MQAVPEPEPPDDVVQPKGIDSLTAAETAMAERQAAQSITTLGNERHPQAGLLGALGWVMYRRHEPRSKYDDYMSSRTLTDITRELGLSSAAADDDDEDEAGKDEPSTSPS
jgi:hypothetical protein